MISKAQVIAVGVATALAIGFSAGWQAQGWKSEAKLNAWKAAAEKSAREATAAARALEQSEANLATTIAEKNAIEAQEARVVDRIVTKEVIRYVKSPNAGQCRLPGEWVRVHDAAASGRVPEVSDAADGLNDAPGTVDDIEALEVVTDNYAKCRSDARRLANLQTWIKEIAGGRETNPN